MTIPTEAWPIIATIFGAIALWVRQNGNAKAEREKRLRIDAESRAFQAEGEAKVKIAEATADVEIRLSAAREDAEERGFMRAQLQAQIRLNEQFQDMLIKKEERDESNYRVVANVQKDGNIALGNLFNKIETTHAEQIAAIGGLPGAILMGIGEALKESAHHLGGEIGVVIAQQFAIQNLDRELFPFPDPEDPAWREEWIRPVTPEPTIHKQPYFADAVKLQKPCSQIKPEGERVRIIRNRIKGWLVIDKFADGSRCWGWLPEHTVEIGAALPSPA